jgi:peptidyl-prolyl cis-trans isomerase B (cyclophilin B)
VRLALVALIAVAAGCGGDGGGDDGGAGGARTTCEEVDSPGAKEAQTYEAPSEPLDASETYRLRFRTSCGDFTVALDPKAAPNTAASLVALAREGFFDDTTFHRVVAGFVIQGGDPTGTGSGGPGYSTVDAPAANTRYTRGVVAMAKTPAEPPGTAGSQFFVVTADDAGLEADYAVVGRVSAGMDTVERIEALGELGTEQPRKPVVIEDVTVETS